MPLREIDRIVDAIYALCRKYEKAGFAEGGESWNSAGTGINKC